MTEEEIIFFRSLIKFFEMAAAVSGLLFWQKWRVSPIRFLIIYLVIICLTEFTGFFLGKEGMYTAKNMLYKYFVLPFEFTFFLFLFGKHLPDVLSKKILRWSFIMFILCWISELLFIDKNWMPFSSFSYSAGNLFLLIIIFRYFAVLIKSEKLLLFYKEPQFWISAGALIFYLGSFPYYLLFNSLVKNYYEELYLPYHIIVIFLNCFMYGVFSITLLWAKPR
jgi:hypothetical protein